MILVGSLIACIVLCVLFAFTAASVGGFVHKATSQCQGLEEESKSAKAWGEVNMWAAIVAGVAVAVIGFMLSRRSKQALQSPELMA